MTVGVQIGSIRDVGAVLPRSLHPAVPDATSHSFSWIGLQALRYWDSAPNEVRWPVLSEHLLVLRLEISVLHALIA